jgi:hypothetical protein
MSHANDMESDKARSHLFSTTKGPNVLLDTMFTVRYFCQCSLKLLVALTLWYALNPITKPYFQIKGKDVLVPKNMAQRFKGRA